MAFLTFVVHSTIQSIWWIRLILTAFSQGEKE